MPTRVVIASPCPLDQERGHKQWAGNRAAIEESSGRPGRRAPHRESETTRPTQARQPPAAPGPRVDGIDTGRQLLGTRAEYRARSGASVLPPSTRVPRIPQYRHSVLASLALGLCDALPAPGGHPDTRAFCRSASATRRAIRALQVGLRQRRDARLRGMQERRESAGRRGFRDSPNSGAGSRSGVDFTARAVPLLHVPVVKKPEP